jgi:hypothetical protein
VARRSDIGVDFLGSDDRWRGLHPLVWADLSSTM